VHKFLLVELVMKLKWPYGRSTVEFEIRDSNVTFTLQPKQLRQLRDPDQAIVKAVTNPIGSGPLEDLVRDKRSVAIIVSDVTRPCPTYRILPTVVRELRRSGVEKSDITIHFATGTHRGNTLDEKRRLIGQDLADNLRLIDHDCRDEGNLISFGKTKRGTNVLVNKNLVESDVRIGLANIDIHYFAGYSGGAKSLVPGMAGYDTIRQNHCLMLLPGAQAGRVKDNPVREDMEEAVKMAGLDFVVNVVLNDSKEIVHVVAGDFVKAHRAGIPPNDHMYKVTVPERGDVVIATAGGYPKDMNLYQAQKALDNAACAVKDGGTIILLAECKEGPGDATFEDWLMKAQSPDEVIQRLREGFMLGGHKAFAIARTAKRAKIALVSSLRPEIAEKAFMTPARSVNEALDRCFSEQGDDATVILMPYAGSTLPCPSA